MECQGVRIDDTFAEAFRMWACRLVVTACDQRWVRIAAGEVTGYAASVIGCDAEAGVERWLPESETPDGRPGVAILFFAFHAKGLAKAVPNRVGQCLMTCPTTAVYDGMPDVMPGAPGTPGDAADRFDLGRQIRFFGDGHQKSKKLGQRRFWRIPVMDGEFLVEETVGCMKAIGGGNFLVCGRTQRGALDATGRGVEAIAQQADVITPFPGGIVRSGSKVGSRYAKLFASTNDAFCPMLRARAASSLDSDVRAVYEVVINGLSEAAVARAMRAAIEAVCAEASGAVAAVSAGNYGGNLGKFHFRLHDVMEASP